MVTLSTFPAEIIFQICTSLNLPSAIAFSRVDQNLRTIVLDHLMRRFQLDIPLNTPAERLRERLAITIINLQLFFTHDPRYTAQFRELRQIPRCRPHPDKIDLVLVSTAQVVALGSIEFLLYYVSQSNFSGEQLLAVYETACSSQHFRMAAALLPRLERRQYSPLSLLCRSYQTGQDDFIKAAKQAVGEEEVAKLVVESYDQLFEAIAASGNRETLATFTKQLTDFEKLKASHLVLAFRVHRPIAEHLLEHLNPEEALRGAYQTKDESLIDLCRDQVEFNDASLELSFACQINDPAVVQLALARIDQEICDQNAATKVACRLGSVSIVKLLIENRLFGFSPKEKYLPYLTTLFQKAQEQGELQELLRLIDQIPNNPYIIASQAYINAYKQAQGPEFSETQAEARAKTQLVQIIEEGSPAEIRAAFETNDKAIFFLIGYAKEGNKKVYLDILFESMQKGLKLDELPIETLSDLFQAACKLAHVELAKALLEENISMDLSKRDKYRCHLFERRQNFMSLALQSGNPNVTHLVKNWDTPFAPKIQPQPPLTLWQKFKAFVWRFLFPFLDILKIPLRKIFSAL